MLPCLLALLAPGLPTPGLGADCDERATSLEVHLGTLEAVEGTPAGLGETLDQMAAWSAACRDHPQAAALTFSAGRLAYEHGHLERALSLLETVASTWPRRPEAIRAAHLVLDVLNQQGDLDGLASTAQRFLADEDLGRQEPRLRADLQRITEQVEFKLADRDARRDPESAAMRYQAFADQFPTSPHADKALFNAAVFYAKIGRTESAHRLHLRLVAEYPASQLTESSLWILAQNHMLLAETDRARAALKRLAAGHGRWAVEAHLNLISLHQILGDRTEALKACRRFVHRHPEHVEVPVLQDLAERLGKTAKRKIPESPQTPLPLSPLPGPAPAFSIAQARRALLSAPHDPSKHLALAFALLAEGKPGPARLVASQGTLQGRHPGLFTILGLAARLQGERDAALRALQSAADLAPGNPQAQINLAMVALESGESGNLSLALKHLRAALRLRPGDVDLRRTLNRLERTQDSTDGALPTAPNPPNPL